MPLNLGGVGSTGPKKFKPQSCAAVFPLLIVNKEEESEAIKDAVPDLRAGIAQLKAEGVTIGGQHHTVKFLSIADLSSIWKLGRMALVIFCVVIDVHCRSRCK